MKNLSPFCTCKNFECPMHPTNHERGCGPCIAENLKLHDVPSCFFNLVDPDHKRNDDRFEDFADCVLSRQQIHD